jgi:hypothetical protein
MIVAVRSLNMQSPTFVNGGQVGNEKQDILLPGPHVSSLLLSLLVGAGLPLNCCYRTRAHIMLFVHLCIIIVGCPFGTRWGDEQPRGKQEFPATSIKSEDAVYEMQ